MWTDRHALGAVTSHTRANFLARLAAAHARGALDDDGWFREMASVFEQAYLAGDNPRAQSGFGGDAARWEAGRRPIVRAIDREGTFLDVGCATG